MIDEVDKKIQLPFDFEHRPSLSGEDFLVAPSNREAVAWLDKWPDWPSPVIICWSLAAWTGKYLSGIHLNSLSKACASLKTATRVACILIALRA